MGQRGSGLSNLRHGDCFGFGLQSILVNPTMGTTMRITTYRNIHVIGAYRTSIRIKINLTNLKGHHE